MTDIWLGRVVENNDPKFEGRVRIRVFGKYDNLEDDELPWVYHMSVINGGSSGGFGEITIPKKDQLIQVIFANGDILSPYWVNFPKINEAVKNEISGDYIDARVLTYDEDNKLKILYLKNSGLLIHLDESEILIGSDNSIKIEHKGTQSIIELIGNKINVVANTEINITSPTVNVIGGNTNLGENPNYSDTMAEPLMDLILKLAALLDAKWPVSGSVAQALVQAAQPLIVSQTVKTTLQ